MKRTIILLVITALALASPAFAAEVKPIWTGEGTNTSVTIDVSNVYVAHVVVWAASGSPDGKVSIYDATPGAPLALLDEYDTPTTAKVLRGPVGVALRVVLSGNTTGTVGAVAVLK